MLPARHIEVQLLADAAGAIVHLFERDCSVQRRHQKVIEITPAPNLDPALRERDLRGRGRDRPRDRLRQRRHRRVPASTRDGRYAFIEINPRIQVEHTVTEETTDVDLVRAQILIAGGRDARRARASTQESIASARLALQCRVTTENPANGFRPDAGRITAYRSPGGAGIRLDEGSAFVGAEVSPYFDPLLVKITARGRDLQSAAARARRAVAELRVRGVSTNQSFLAALLRDPDVPRRADAHGVRRRAPATWSRPTRAPTAPRACSPGSSDVDGQPRARAAAPTRRPARQAAGDRAAQPPPGSRQRLLELGPAALRRGAARAAAVAVTDTTLRDAHQSLLATRMRTFDMLAAAPAIAR